MRLRNLVLTGFGILGVVKLIEMLEIVRIDDIKKVLIKVDKFEEGSKENELEDYDPEYTPDEDILDELEVMDSSEVEEVVKDLAPENPEPERLNVKSSSRNSKEKNLGLTIREQEIMNLFDKNSRVDTDILSEKIKGTTVRTLRRDLEKLEKQKLVKKVGKTKGSYYVKL